MKRTSGRMGSRQAIFLSRRLNRCTLPIDFGMGCSRNRSLSAASQMAYRLCFSTQVAIVG